MVLGFEDSKGYGHRHGARGLIRGVVCRTWRILSKYGARISSHLCRTGTPTEMWTSAEPYGRALLKADFVAEQNVNGLVSFKGCDDP